MADKNKSKLSMAAIKAATKELGIALPKTDPAGAADILERHFMENHEKDALAVCGFCGYPATEDWVKCPYCGTKLGASVEAPTKNKKSKKDKKKQTPAKKPGALAKPDPKKVELCKERIEEIKSYRRNLAEEAYKIGVAIKEIHDKALFKHMGHGSFAAFCKAELDYTRVMAYKYMGMAGSKLLKKADAINLGVSKVDIVLKAPERHQKVLLKMGRDGKSRAEMEDYLKQVQSKGKAGGGSKDPSKITLVGRANMGDSVVQWIGDKSGKPTTRDTKGKHAIFEIVSGFELTVRETDDGKGLVFTLQKIEPEPVEPTEPEETNPPAEDDENVEETEKESSEE